MFLKAFVVFSCLVLYTISKSISKGNRRQIETDNVLSVISKMNCSTHSVQDINFTRPNTQDLCTTYQDTFCQINKALNYTGCTQPEMGKLRRLSYQIQKNATCTLRDNGVIINMQTFLKNLKGYIDSFRSQCIEV